ncbi:kanadaptin-like [Uloborus diversus]|uniref:kanadaptin-like n=1 Tax=Uloborus diversus TaxID=327109 RepID=UPI002409C7B7|nr:kanadaptin-like [Uloborus diversus]
MIDSSDSTDCFKVPEKVAERIPEAVAEKIPKEVAEMMPEKVAEKIPKEVAEMMPEKVAENIPEKIAENVPEKIAEKIPEKVPETTPEQKSEGFRKPESLKIETESSKLNRKSEKKIRAYVPLPYKEPDWSGVPPPNFCFEVIKNGTVVDTIKVLSSFIVFGRLDTCEIVLEHPSVSRFHAIVQYCRGDESHPKGFYLYDLGSTHGTFLNKQQIKSNIYYKLKVGYIVKFGGSTRLHVFQGPEEELEAEVKPVAEKKDDNVCDWGMCEDADEEEDLTENPFAVSTPNEELYIDDPKKTLRNWFEREGYEVEYNVEEKGFKTFMCRVQLPIDTPSGDFMSVEASVSGKKKEAVVACALEACRTLDRLGLLHQSKQESRQRKKKKWEENDYYDSDEDTFLDRTGVIERKREMRKMAEKKFESETYESLQMKLKGIEIEIEDIKSKICAEKNTTNSAASQREDDSLDAYMSTLSETDKVPSDKFERTKLKVRLAEAEKEKSRLEKMLDIAKPTKLPPVASYPGMIGKRLKSKLQLPVADKKESLKQSGLPGDEEEVEDEEDDLDSSVKLDKSNKIQISTTSGKVQTPKETATNKIVENNIKLDSEIKNVDNVRVGKNFGLMTKNEYESTKMEIEEALEKKDNKPSSLEKHSQIPSKRVIGPEKPVESEQLENMNVSAAKRVKQRSKSKPEEKVDVYKIENAEYSNWIPPKNQTGDGMTHLNEKYGY